MHTRKEGGREAECTPQWSRRAAGNPSLHEKDERQVKVLETLGHQGVGTSGGGGERVQRRGRERGSSAWQGAWLHCHHSPVADYHLSLSLSSVVSPLFQLTCVPRPTPVISPGSDAYSVLPLSWPSPPSLLAPAPGRGSAAAPSGFLVPPSPSWSIHRCYCPRTHPARRRW